MNVSSTQGFCLSQACGIYTASKVALEAVSEACSVEVAPVGIRVLIIETGAFRSFGRAGSAPYITPSEEYAGQHIVDRRLAQIGRLPELATGDPGKAAKVMFEAAIEEGDAGLLIKRETLGRIIIGPDSWQRIDEKVDELRRSTDRVKDVAASTNF